MLCSLLIACWLLVVQNKLALWTKTAKNKQVTLRVGAAFKQQLQLNTSIGFQVCCSDVPFVLAGRRRSFSRFLVSGARGVHAQCFVVPQWQQVHGVMSSMACIR